MTKIIEIDGIIGWDVWPSMISAQLKEANGEDIVIHLNSDGGYMSDGLAIYNHIQDYQGKTTAKIMGVAASISSIIPLAAEKVIAKSNSIMFIHDAIMLIYGNEEDHLKGANYLNRASNLLADIYAKKTGKSKKEIRTLMKKEEFFFGNEMLDFGLVDEMEEVDFNENKDDLILNAMIRSEDVVKKINQKPEDFQKIAAFFPSFKVQNGKKIIAGATTFKNYPIYEKPWDSDAAVRRWREHSGSTEEPSKNYKNGFFWFDEDAPENFGSFKLPYVDIVNNTVYAVRRGVFAANGAMGGARGGINIPAGDKPAVQSHIDKYLKKIEKFDEEQQDVSNQRQSALNTNIIEDETMSEKLLTVDEFLTLDGFLDKNIQAKLEYEKRLANAEAKGNISATSQMQSNIERMRPLMQAEGCSDALKQAGFDALSGEIEFNTFIALAEYEARQFEAKRSNAADGEQQGDTPPCQSAENTERPKNADDMKALVAELKKQV